jgi:hypothetical protein
VGELDHDGGRHDLRRVDVAEAGRQQGQHGAEPLAAGLRQVPRALAEHGVVGLHRRQQPRLDVVEGRADGCLECAVDGRNAQTAAQTPAPPS